MWNSLSFHLFFRAGGLYIRHRWRIWHNWKSKVKMKQYINIQYTHIHTEERREQIKRIKHWMLSISFCLSENDFDIQFSARRENLFLCFSSFWVTESLIWIASSLQSKTLVCCFSLCFLDSSPTLIITAVWLGLLYPPSLFLLTLHVLIIAVQNLWPLCFT